MDTITISIERFQQLLRAEQDAHTLKAMIEAKYDTGYSVIDRDEIKILHAVYCGESEVFTC